MLWFYKFYTRNEIEILERVFLSIECSILLADLPVYIIIYSVWINWSFTDEYKNRTELLISNKTINANLSNDVPLNLGCHCRSIQNTKG